jgi:hypothetical protein
MASLPKHLRKQLENAVKRGRRVADAGARKALEGLAAGHHEPWPSMTPNERALRNRLRAHGRQLGDRLDAQKGTQSVAHLAGEVAYEQWHRMLFARFLAENELLIEPQSGMAVSIDEVRDLARRDKADWMDLAAGWAQRMLPQIFRSGDPVLEVPLPPEERLELEEIVASLPPEVFHADDSLGWVYQFWQAEKKKTINDSGVKIGADELPAVTQLFTEDYMVDFLLDNTLGAWWAGKKLAENPDLIDEAFAKSFPDLLAKDSPDPIAEDFSEPLAKDFPTEVPKGDEGEENNERIAIEEALREAVSLPGVPWSYLRFIRNEAGRWTPAAGAFDGWPKNAKELTCLDPCMGSGHFIVAMFTRLVALRIAEEQLDEKSAISAVIENNLFGLEIDPRCTQIAAFNLALSAWKRVGHCPLPSMNLACSGLGINAKEEEWVALAGKDEQARAAMQQLWQMFSQAPQLGSLINPRRVGGDLFTANFAKVRPLLEVVLVSEEDHAGFGDLAVTAAGVLAAAAVLSSRYVLIATNVPYLSIRRQEPTVRKLLGSEYGEGKACLSTAFLQRLLVACEEGGSIALVTPQHWLFQPSYRILRANLLRSTQWIFLAPLGTGAFETISGEMVNVCLVGISRLTAAGEGFVTIDALEATAPNEKSTALKNAALTKTHQAEQLTNPEARVMSEPSGRAGTMQSFAEAPQGIITGDLDHWQHFFWEHDVLAAPWVPFLSTTSMSAPYTAREHVVNWSGANRDFIRPRPGNRAVGKKGIAVSQMGDLAVTLYTGEAYDGNVAPIVPLDCSLVPALWVFANSDEYRPALRQIDRAGKLTNGSLLKISFDERRWRSAAAQLYPYGLPEPSSSDPTQWLFAGRPGESDHALYVAVARLVGFRWPRQTDFSFPYSAKIETDGLERHEDQDGIVCLTSVKGERSAPDRLRALLADAYATDWSAAKLNELLDRVGYAGKPLEEWLRDGFFPQHCDLFHQRPFVWQIWDGVKDGFSALVNYHKLAAPNGEGRKTLEKLLYSYLGDWIERRRADQKRGVEGADLKLAAAEHLAFELGKILEGEPPYDLFIRWKPLHEQPIGWDPDINDGVRLNIRPFLVARTYNAKARNACILRTTPNIKYEKADRGNEPIRLKEDFPWFWSWDRKAQDFTGANSFDGKRWNGLHYKRDFKEKARARVATKTVPT